MDYPKAQFLADSEIRRIAIDEGRVVVTKDEDFADYFWAKGSPPRVLLVAMGNIKNNDLIDLFEANLDEILQFFEHDREMVIFNATNLVVY